QLRQLQSVMEELPRDAKSIQRTANRMIMMLSDMSEGAISKTQLTALMQRMEQELFPQLPKETVQWMRQTASYLHANSFNTSSKSAEMIQQSLLQMMELFNQEGAFQVLSDIASTLAGHSPIDRPSSLQGVFL